MSVPDYLKDMDTSGLPGRVPEYGGFIAAVSEDDLLQSDAKLFCMAFGYLEQEVESLLHDADSDKPTNELADALLKLKLLVRLEEVLPSEMQQMIAFLREQRSKKKGIST